MTKMNKDIEYLTPVKDMESRKTVRTVETEVFVVQTKNYTIEVLEDAEGTVHVRKRDNRVDHTEEPNWEWSYATGFQSHSLNAHDRSEVVHRAIGWSPEFDGENE